MYIRSYQIHNVLNVYRKQLSHGNGGNGSKGLSGANARDRINISADGQRQSIMNKISSEIVERISQTGPNNQFESVLADRLTDKSQQRSETAAEDQQGFKYTTIDENNKKITNTLAIHGFNPHVNGITSKPDENIGKKPSSEME